ncbi:catabolite gene activator protein [Spirochaetia bacterium]|nr:catabolite gene activator protein [Spirochaetia bacterium]
MPKALQFKSGSLIYFQGEVSDKIFILQTGTVNLAYQDIEKGTDVHDLVQPGEFFGVKSALGRYPREENAIAIQDAAVMAFAVPEFEALAVSNTRIIMKMLKVFSNQLRRIHSQVSQLMEKEEAASPDAGLFKIGEYYLKNQRFSQAKYVFSRYLSHYPSGKNAAQAARNLAAAEAYAGPSTPPQGKPGGNSATAYYDAISMVSREKYQEAYQAFKKIVDTNEESEYAAKSFYEIGRCLYLLNKFDECIKHFTGMIPRYPKHPDLAHAIFFMGQAYEKLTRKEQAVIFYKKFLSMSSDADEALNIRARRALKALEA